MNMSTMTTMATMSIPILCALVGAAPSAPEPLLAHSHDWVRDRMTSMLAVDDAYLWHEVLGGRAIHQNSNAEPPTEPLRGSFHTQQQAFFASVKMDMWELTGELRHIDDARHLLRWVVDNGYDPQRHQFYLVWNRRSREWNTSFHPEFNMMSVAALTRYNAIRPREDFRAVAEDVLAHIRQTQAFDAQARKSLYTSGYIALELLDMWDATGDERALRDARRLVRLADHAMWDAEHGGWLYVGAPAERPPRHTVKHTHTNSNMIQACLRLHLAGARARYLDRALRTLHLLAEHSRTDDGGWYRHNTRDWSDPTRPPGVGDAATTETGAVCVYDRMAQMMVACALAYRATQDARYLRWIDATLHRMERTHLTRYPAGVNYGYITSGDTQNTWCHLWGLKAMLAIDALWRDFG